MYWLCLAHAFNAPDSTCEVDHGSAVRRVDQMLPVCHTQQRLLQARLLNIPEWCAHIGSPTFEPEFAMRHRRNKDHCAGCVAPDMPRGQSHRGCIFRAPAPLLRTICEHAACLFVCSPCIRTNKGVTAPKAAQSACGNECLVAFLTENTAESASPQPYAGKRSSGSSGTHCQQRHPSPSCVHVQLR